jgi:pyrroloquinoline quinone (PQQ) biosynthesis protein C
VTTEERNEIRMAADMAAASGFARVEIDPASVIELVSTVQDLYSSLAEAASFLVIVADEHAKRGEASAAAEVRRFIERCCAALARARGETP